MSSHLNYYQDGHLTEAANALQDARLEVPRALVEVWQAVALHEGGYWPGQIERLEQWIRDEVDEAWHTKAHIKFDRRSRSVEIADGPVKILIEDLAAAIDLNMAVK